jgi:hypothetical protein
MQRCMHSEHKTAGYDYTEAGKAPGRVGVFKGFNPVHDRWEICDPGLADDEKPQKKSEPK